MSKSFDLKFSGKVDDLIPVFKYRSKNTGLSVVVAQVKGPIVNGYFCLATEAHDDDGLPHTLEHLVFMGSEKYPYKGVLDLLANRSLASGTNAWTDTDHTCYTMTTAGSEGFLNLMPIYLDHVLYPTLTESAYVTEVHHINGEGEDAGVVYCEMQDCENTGENRTRLALLRSMYPGKCGYKSETGGALENLRTSTSHKKVCDYHHEFYRPENLCLVITGQVQPEEVCKRLEEFEQKIQSKGALPPHTRPWQSPVPPLTETVEKTVKYPSDEAKNGMVSIGWRGPQCKDQYSQCALNILCEYLTDTPVAPLQSEFVEISEPYCNDVSYSMTENSVGCLSMKFKNVPVEKLSLIKDKLFEVLSAIGKGEEPIDMERMGVVTHKRILESMTALEDEPHDTIAFYIIGDFLYGDDNSDLDTRLNQIKTFKKLKEEKIEFWQQLLTKYLLTDKYVAILGEPSVELMKSMGDDEKARVAKQRDALGKKGLKKKDNELEDATEKNEEEPPEAMLTCVDVPDVGCIQFHPIVPSNNHASKQPGSDQQQQQQQQQALFPLDNMPVTFQLDDIETKFIDMTVMCDTSTVPEHLQCYLPLYSEIITESPILRDGKLIPHELIINELEADTVSKGCSLGISGSRFKPGSYATLMQLYVKTEREKYAKGVQWLRELLYQVQFKPDRLKIVATKMLNDVASMKRKGRTVVNCALNSLLFKKDYIIPRSNMLRQQKFLDSLVKQLDDPGTAEQIVEHLEQLRQIVTEPRHLRVHLSAHVPTLAASTDPVLPWTQSFLPEAKQQQKQEHAQKAAVTLPESAFLNKNGDVSGVLIGVGSVESSFLVQTVPCVTDFNHEDLPAISVFIQYLTQLEGPMWRQIRGLGLSYHYSMSAHPEDGQLYFILYKATHLVKAYKKAKAILEDILSGKQKWSEVEFESCKSSLIFEVIEEEKSPGDASHESMMSYLRGVSKDYHKNFIKRIPDITIADMKRVGPKYIAPIFDVKKSKTAIVCHPTKVQEIVGEMKKTFHRDLKVVENLEDSFLAEL